MRNPKLIILDGLFWLINKIVHRKKIEFNPVEIKKILISKYCCIGDVLMTTPLVAEIHKNFPNARIDYYVGDWSKAVLENNENITNIYINKPETRKTLKEQFKNEKYDIIFVLDIGINDIYFVYSLKPKILVGIDAFNRGFLLNYKTKHAIGDGIHERDVYSGTLESMGIKTTIKDMHMTLTKEESAFADDFFRKNGLSGTKVIGVFPGGGKNPGTTMNLKQWGEEKYAELCNQLIKKDFSMMLLGAPNEKDIIIKIEEKIEGEIIDASGFSIRETAALIKKCNLFISNDSGPMHIAAAIGTKTISIFGPTNPSLLKPYGEKHYAFYTMKNCVPDYSIKNPNHNCHPCYRLIIGDFNHSCKTKDCMNKIRAEDVEKKVCEMTK